MWKTTDDSHWESENSRKSKEFKIRHVVSAENIWYGSCKIFRELARFTRDPHVIDEVQSQITELGQLMVGQVDTFSNSMENLQQSLQVCLCYI